MASKISPFDRVDRLQSRPCRDSGRLVAVAQFDRLMVRPVEAPDGTAARPHRAVFEHHIDLDRRIAAAESRISRPMMSMIAVMSGSEREGK
jgi:hypothetical protein